ncbi:helix-turn-helix transcriptional regulator [Tepidiforma thermophila]|uniref:MarR family protein n=1 Tax=Tepidiforma thermophila (strain KCTC 52669 / CGMCC 1.13589 / G233) TaxID=2761530 RepID=A0A2A9HD43_TEPT2|nr:winged helix-turn-helix domain-containing protein [Tepidiforma thermophila]PFG72926.1 MarR family protein [Tepidiforma thermophila]
MAEWSLFTNHANVLLAITRNPDIRLRELAAEVGISERAVKRIVADLERAGYLQRERHGRRNHYQINTEAAVATPIARGVHLGALITALLPMIAQSI